MAGLLNFGGQKKKRMYDEAARVNETAFVVIDTELTGLNERKDSIVSLGAVRMSGGRISLGDTFYRLVKPRASLTRESVIIHGIMPCDVVSEKDSAAVLSEFMSFCGVDIIVGHCVAIDVEFIDREMKQVLGGRLNNQVLDTVELYRWMMNRGVFADCQPRLPKDPELYRLARCLDIPFTEEHHALGDAFITAQLFQRLLPLLQEEGIATLGDLIRVGDPSRGGDRFRSPGEISNL